MDLTSDSKFFIVVPQHLLYYVPTEDSDDEESGSSVDDLANTTFSTIDSRPSTKAERSAEEILPDFAIIRVKCRFRNPALGRTYLNVKIRYAGAPVLVEVKRAGSRSLHGVRFLKSTQVEIGKAGDDLFRQAAYMFMMHKRQQYVVMVACSGVYWACMLADRTTVMDRVDPKPADSFLPDLDDPDDPDGHVDSDDEDGGEDMEDELFDEDIDELDLIGQSEVHVANTDDEPSDASAPSGPPQSENDFLEPVVAITDLALPENRWTKLLHLDTRASNQKMFLIHSHLRDVRRDNTGAKG